MALSRIPLNSIKLHQIAQTHKYQFPKHSGFSFIKWKCWTPYLAIVKERDQKKSLDPPPPLRSSLCQNKVYWHVVIQIRGICFGVIPCQTFLFELLGEALRLGLTTPPSIGIGYIWISSSIDFACKQISMQRLCFHLCLFVFFLSDCSQDYAKTTGRIGVDPDQGSKSRRVFFHFLCKIGSFFLDFSEYNSWFLMKEIRPVLGTDPNGFIKTLLGLGGDVFDLTRNDPLFSLCTPSK